MYWNDVVERIDFVFGLGLDLIGFGKVRISLRIWLVLNEFFGFNDWLLIEGLMMYVGGSCYSGGDIGDFESIIIR